MPHDAAARRLRHAGPSYKSPARAMSQPFFIVSWICWIVLSAPLPGFISKSRRKLGLSSANWVASRRHGIWELQNDQETVSNAFLLVGYKFFQVNLFKWFLWRL